MQFYNVQEKNKKLANFYCNKNILEEKMQKFYCEYCGASFASVTSLVSGTCMRHPNGSLKGKHKLYEGSEKSTYTCKYCGQKYSTLSNLVSGTCMRHPNGSLKGKHAPSL